jgi:signal transduction histidine kinase
LPFFTVNISEDGEISAFGGDYFDLTDKEMLQDLVNAVEERKKDTGILSDYDLRYMKSENDRMNAIVFADISSEKAMIKGLIRNSVIIGLIGYVIFFLISLILAKWVTKPVEKTWNEQKQFIADASHELKTPLTVIMTNAEMMSDKSYSESDRDGFTRNILSTSKRMRGLVESLLELARLDNNRAQIKLETVNLSKLINDSILPFEPLFYENEMELSADIDDGISVEGNKEKLRQVINILLDNALKYSDPADNVRVKLKRQGSECVLSVSGLGTPLTKEECVNIFKRFYRVDQARNDGQSYGLGLSIADSIIKEHNGKIWAESADGYNTFLVSLTL